MALLWAGLGSKTNSAAESVRAENMSAGGQSGGSTPQKYTLDSLSFHVFLGPFEKQ